MAGQEQEKEAPELRVAKLFQLAGHEMTQAVGAEPGTVDWFATPREGFVRPRTYWRAWKTCPERLDEALAELEQARVARGADRALGVVMEGRLPEGYATDLGRVTGAISYRRLALEVSGIAARVRDQVSRYEAEEGPRLYLPIRGRINAEETVEATAYIKEWAGTSAADSLLVVGQERLSWVIPVRHAAYEIGVQFNLSPESVIPLVIYRRDEDTTPFEEGFAIPVTPLPRPAPLRALRTLAYEAIHTADLDDDDLKGPRMEVARPTSGEVDRWYHDHLHEQAYARLVSAQEAEPAFLVLSTQWVNLRRILDAALGAPAVSTMSTEAWMAQVVVAYMTSLAPSASEGLESLAFSQFSLGGAWDKTDTRGYEDRFPKDASRPPESETWIENWSAYFEGEAPVLNRLVQDYFVARRVAREVEQGRIEILTRHQFPEKYVLLFLAVLSPSSAARSADIRAQIESGVERRLQLVFAHMLKRSAGAARSHLRAIQRHIERTTPGALSYELARIDEEMSYQSALAEQTRLWREVPLGEVEGLGLREYVANVVADLREGYPSVSCTIDVGQPVRVRGTHEGLKEIVHCLVENAFQAAMDVRANAEGWRSAAATS
jgi:hypothetical protein